MKGKCICLLSLYLSLCIITSCGPPVIQKSSPVIQKGDFAPDLLGDSLDGNKVRLSEFKGKVVVLIFWKTWCDACRKELIEMKTLLHEYKDKFILLAINIGESRNEVRTFKRHFLLDFPVLLDPETKTFSAYGIHVWPTTILIDQQGRVYWTSVGSEVELLRQEIEALLPGGK